MRVGVCLLALVAAAWLTNYLSYAPCQAAEEAASAPANPANPSGDSKSEEPQRDSAVWWFLRSSGLIGLFILGLSTYFVALVIRLFTHMRVEVEVPRDVMAKCRELITKRDFQAAYDAASASDSYLGRVLAKGIAHLQNGLAEARHAMERLSEAETVRLEKQISMMAVLGTLGPMIGLIGTLKGMIASFSVIALSGATLKANQVAQGISEALLLTFEGVSLSIPAIYFFAYFRNRVTTISAEAMVEGDDLLQLFSRASRGRSGSGSGSASPATPPRA